MRWSARCDSRRKPGNNSAQILLHEPRAEMDVHLYQRLLPDAAKAVNFTCLDHENVARAGLELLPVDLIEPSPGPNELDLIVRMPVWSRPASRQGAQQERGDRDVAMVGPDEVVRAAVKRQVLLSNSEHCPRSGRRRSRRRSVRAVGAL